MTTHCLKSTTIPPIFDNHNPISPFFFQKKNDWLSLNRNTNNINHIQIYVKIPNKIINQAKLSQAAYITRYPTSKCPVLPALNHLIKIPASKFRFPAVATPAAPHVFSNGQWPKLKSWVSHSKSKKSPALTLNVKSPSQSTFSKALYSHYSVQKLIKDSLIYTL